MDRLFLMGVIEDDDRPRQLRPQPVRCLEDELVGPVIDPRPRCKCCYLSYQPVGHPYCAACRRELEQKAKHKGKLHDDRTERKLMDRIGKTGALVATGQNERTLSRLVEGGLLRWATHTERRRLGYERFENVAVLPANRTKTG